MSLESVGTSSRAINSAESTLSQSAILHGTSSAPDSKTSSPSDTLRNAGPHINATSYIQQHHPLHVYCHC
jgi:hypothetical protein